MTGTRRSIVTVALFVLLAHDAGAQVAFQPVIGVIRNGPSLGVTPSVSFDRRYVRLGVNPQFIGVEGFDTYLVPAAVSSGPGGPGAVLGGQFLAGMNGVIAPNREADYAGIPQGHQGFPGNPAWDNFPQPGPGALPARPQLIRKAPPRPAASKTVRRGRSPGQKAKHPASAAAPANGIKGGNG